MKIVVNRNWGGFTYPQELEKQFEGVSERFTRVSIDLINWVEAHEDETDLRVVEVSDDLTDWIISDYDGMETLYYVLNGMIFSA